MVIGMMSHTKIAHLTIEEKQRYLKKIDTLGLDPYLLPSELLIPLKSCKILPNLTFADIYIYLIHNPSPYTGEALKAFKSTEPTATSLQDGLMIPKFIIWRSRNVF